MVQLVDASQTETVVWEDAVKEAKQILVRMDGRKEKMRLGELAHKVEPTWGENTLGKFAKEINFCPRTLERYRSVYRAWDGQGIQAPGPVSYAVMRALQGHPQREALVNGPTPLTKGKAEKLMAAYEGKEAKSKKDDKRKTTGIGTTSVPWRRYQRFVRKSNARPISGT
jgi:hypothetical protein